MDAVPESSAVSQKTTIFQGAITIIIPKISQFSCFLHNETDETVTLKHCIYPLFYCSFAEIMCKDGIFCRTRINNSRTRNFQMNIPYRYQELET